MNKNPLALKPGETYVAQADRQNKQDAQTMMWMFIYGIAGVTVLFAILAFTRTPQECDHLVSCFKNLFGH